MTFLGDCGRGTPVASAAGQYQLIVQMPVMNGYVAKPVDMGALEKERKGTIK